MILMEEVWDILGLFFHVMFQAERRQYICIVIDYIYIYIYDYMYMIIYIDDYIYIYSDRSKGPCKKF